MRKILLTLIFISSLFFTSLKAQEMLGIANSNYAGITGVHLNPSSIVGSRMKWDVNLIGADIFLQNNYVYHPNIYLGRGSDTAYQSYEGFRDYYTPNPAKNAFINLTTYLPSFMFRVKKHTFAFVFNTKLQFSLTDLDYRLAKFAYDERHLGYAPQQNQAYEFQPFNIAMMYWGELGLSYGYPIINKNRNYLAGAFTAKRLFGLAGIYLNSNKLNIEVRENNNPNITGPSQDIFVNGIDWEFGYGIANEETFFPGGGFGFDVGFTYERKRNEGFIPFHKRNRIQQYIYKAGISMIDIGAISFTENTRQSAVQVETPFTFADVNNTNFNSPDSLDYQLSTTAFNGDALASSVGNSFDIGLPTAISAQFDYNLNDRFYINAIAVQSVPLYKYSIKRPSQIAVGPRFETKYFEVAAPYSLYNYQDHRIGLCFRMGPLIIGSDKLGAFLGLNDFTGLDFYFAIKIGSYLDGKSDYDPNKCFYKRIFKKFQRKKPGPKAPVVKF